MIAKVVSAAILLVLLPNLRADEKRYQFLVAMLDAPISVDVEEAPLRLLLTTIEDLASPPGSDRDPQKKVKILMDETRFKRKCKDFELERLPPIKLPGKIAAVSLSTVLRIICDQVDAVFIVGREYIEIVPAAPFRHDLGWPEDEEHASRSLNPLVHCHYKQMMLSQALEFLAEKTGRSIVLSKQVPDDLAKKEIDIKLANTPFETAIEFLAASADLKVVARGDSYFVTTRRQAAEMLRKRTEPVNAPVRDDAQASKTVLAIPDQPFAPVPKGTLVSSGFLGVCCYSSSERSTSWDCLIEK